ncbi:MAG: carboxypeptidase regulatory-like domain-containing protein [Methanosarcinales archaeon]|nr:carboxypeptidase regulatory-like domain-containing protein [Methanosarcinales archaeon]
MDKFDTINTYRIVVATLAAIAMLSVIPAASASVSVQEFGTDSNRYLAGTNITVSGKVLNGTTGEPSANVTVMIYNGSWSFETEAVAGSDGSFSSTVTAPDTEGSYKIVGTSSGVNSTNVSILVYGAAGIQTVDITLTTGTVHTVTLSSSHGIDSDMSTATMTGGNLTIDSTEYRFLVSESDVVYVDNDGNINFSASDSADGMSPIGNLETGSKVKLDQTYTIAFVDNASEIVLMRKVAPVFTGNGTQNVTILALNASGSPVSDESLTLRVIYDNGTTANTTTLTATDSCGLVTTSIEIQSDPGVYHIMIEDENGGLGHLSYSVNTYDMYGEVLSPDYDPQYTFARGQDILLAAYLKDASSGVPLNGSTASVTAEVRGPDQYSASYTLTYDSSYGMFNCTASVPADASLGTYHVEYTATIGTAEQKAQTTFEVSGYDIFLHAICPQRPDVEGFSPGETGYIFIGGVELATGAEADVNGLTGESSKDNFTLAIKNSAGADVTGDWGVMNLATFVASTNVPPWIQDELKREAVNASIINFTAPSATGVYEIVVSVNLNGTVEERSTGIGVQSIFVHGQPCASDGSFAPSVQQKSNVTMMIMAFDPKNMREVPRANITDAGLIEVYSETGSDVVTEKMEMVTFVDRVGSTDFAGIKFYVNDSYLGFHHVKFWINASVDGTPTTAVGEGFFETRLYYIWVTPTTTDGGAFKSFTSDSDVSLNVTVENSGHTAESGLPVAIDEVRYCRNWEKVEYDAGGDSSGRTDSDGVATLSISPTDPLKSGDYSVRVKVTGTNIATGETVYDYGRGWFEVRNFMLDIYPENWNVKTGEDINFSVRAVNSTNMSSDMTVDLTLDKIVYTGSWDNPQRKLIEEGAAITPSTVTTNSTTQETVTYTGGENLTKSGGYEFIFEAEADGAIETERVWVYCEPYVAWAYTPGWDQRFGIGSEMSVLVRASDSWGGGDAHNINASETNVTMVRKEGMFGEMPYKTRDEMIINVTQKEPNIVNLTINLTDWLEGEYFMTIKVVDEDGVEVFTNFWFQVELASIGLPEFYRVNIPDGNTYTTATSFNLTQSPSQVGDDEKEENGRYRYLNYTVATNSYIGKVCHQEGIQLLSDWNLEDDRTPFWALVNRTVPQTLYVNYESANFSDATNTTLLHEGDTWNESDENGTTVRRWNVTAIGSDGTINLEGIDCLGTGYKIDTSLSKSGSFIIGEMWDCDWLKIDLDNDGSYMPGDYESGSGRYYIALADNATERVYDTVLVSNSTNFTDAINATSGTEVTFGGDPIYMIDLKYENSRYVIQFTSYHTGWGGMCLGTFAQDSVIKVPFLVQTPGGGAGISGASVEIDSLRQFGSGGIPISGVNNTTNANGLAMLEINTSEVANGQYMIHYNVTLPEAYGNVSVAPEEEWRLPMLEIRSFIVGAYLGTVGNITVNKVYNGHGIDVVYGEELDAKGAAMLFDNTGQDDVLHVGWPFDCEDDWYFNTSTGRYYDCFDNATSNSTPVANDSINLTRGSEVITYNFTAYYPSGDSYTLNTSESKLCWDYWNVTLNSTDGTNASLTVEYALERETDWNPETHTVQNDSEIMWGPGPLEIHVTNIGDTNITFESRSARALYHIDDLETLFDGDESNGELDCGRVTRANYSDYIVYAYNDVNETEREKAWDDVSEMDRILVTNGSSTNIYRIGEDIPELGRYVAMAMGWGGKIIFANETLTHGIYPFCEWASDGDTYYTGTFTEEDVQNDLNNDEDVNDNQTYYIRLDDTNPNGVPYPSEGIFDDDRDLTTVRTEGTPADMYGAENGSTDPYSGQKRDERFLELGSLWGWPFSIPRINTSGDPAVLTTLASDDCGDYTLEDNISMYITAKTFSNEPVDGDITVDKLMVLCMDEVGEGGAGGEDDYGDDWEDDMMMEPVIYTNTTAINATMTDGVGVLEITYGELRDITATEFDFGEFIVQINVTDDAGGNSETVMREFEMESEESEMGGD